MRGSNPTNFFVRGLSTHFSFLIIEPKKNTHIRPMIASQKKKTPWIWLQLFPASLVRSCNMNCEIHKRIVALWDYYQTENKNLIGLELFQILIISQIKAHVFEPSQPWCRMLICWKWMKVLEMFLKKLINN